MSDNVQVTPGVGSTIATDDVGGVQYQRVKPAFGTDGNATDVSTTNPLPVTLPSSVTIKVDGSAVVQPVSTNADGTTGSAIPSKGLLVQGSDGTNARNVATTTAGIVKVDISGTAANSTAIKVDNSAVTQPVSNAGTFAVQAAQSGNWTARAVGNSGAVMDGVNTAATAPANGLLGLGIYNTTEPSPTTGQSVGIQLDAKGRQRHVIMDAAGNTRGANVDSSNRLSTTIDNIASAGAASVGGSATGSAVPSNAVYKGLNPQTSLPSAATAGNLVGAMADKFGRQVALVNAIRDIVGTQTTTISASTSETTIATAAASTFLDLYMLIVSNTSSATNTRIDFRDTTAGSVLFSLQSNGGQPPIGFSVNVPIPQTSVNTNWTAQCATSTTDVRVYAVFIKNK